MSFKLVVVGQYDTNIGARTYVMDTPTTYKQWHVKNREFVFDVDVSKLPCGVNGALYFVDMDADGGSARFAGNKAGAAYGTGYCDAQCPHDDKFINGEANIVGWAPDPNGDPNSGDGKFGTCCTEMDIWEANMLATAVTPHMCTVNGQYRCNGTECGDDSAGQRFLGVCDKNGCDMNPYRAGDTNFFGPGGGQPQSACNLQVGVNNGGVILGPPTIQIDPTSCCALCNATASCAGFTYVEASSNCFLKSSVGAPTADAGATSGVKPGPPPPATASVDTTRPFTVVTQFVTDDGTDTGELTEIVRFFVQDNVTIPHPSAPSIPPGNFSSITDAFCKAKGQAWGDNDNFEAFGGLARMGQVLDGGVTLVLSQWLDYEEHMLWLDATSYPPGTPPGPGVARGPCATTTGVPADVISQNPDATVVYSKITVAPIGTTTARLAAGRARV